MWSEGQTTIKVDEKWKVDKNRGKNMVNKETEIREGRDKGKRTRDNNNRKKMKKNGKKEKEEEKAGIMK